MNSSNFIQLPLPDFKIIRPVQVLVASCNIHQSPDQKRKKLTYFCTNKECVVFCCEQCITSNHVECRKNGSVKHFDTPTYLNSIKNIVQLFEGQDLLNSQKVAVLKQFLDVKQQEVDQEQLKELVHNYQFVVNFSESIQK